QLIAKFIGYEPLQPFNLLIPKFDNPPGLEVDQMVMMSAGHLLVAGPAVAKIMLGENIRFLEQSNRAVDRCDTDVRVERGRPPVTLLDSGMIRRFGQHPCDDPALLGHLQTLVEAELFKPRDHHASLMASLIRAQYSRRHPPIILRKAGSVTTRGVLHRRHRHHARDRRARVPRPISLANRLRWRGELGATLGESARHPPPSPVAFGDIL